MSKKNLFKLDWRSTLSSVIIGLGTVVIARMPATALPIESEIKLSQVGVRSRITTPTPLNLRPRIHIPSPSGNHSRYQNHHYTDRYEGCSYYGDCRHPRSRRTHRKKGRNNTTIIIINSDNHRTYRNHHDNGYIRVIRK